MYIGLPPATVVYWYRYEQFHTAVLTKVGAWPSVVQHSVQEYDSALCQYLRVGREPPATRKVS